MAVVRLDNITKQYPGGHLAVQDFSLHVADGELLVLVGPSGCGKSTVLRVVAGLETPTRGRVFLDEREVTTLPPQARDVAMVFQSYALYPHLKVRENLAFGLRMRGVSKARIATRVEHAARMLGLDSLLDRRPAQLSGGQRQRVALGRAIVREPQAFLLDEPLSNLDARLRVETRTELARLHRRLGTTTLYVTHDQEEAMTLGDRIAVLREGHSQQVAPPLEVYRRPANVFVAGFIGSPTMNFLPCLLRRDSGRITLAGPAFTLELAECRPPLEARSGKVLLGVRPHDVALVAPQQADVSARVEVNEPRGNEVVMHVIVEEGTSRSQLTVVTPPENASEVGEQVGLRFRRDRLHLFDSDSGERIA
jgi:multiple sugar transport system ATP-binding protein